MNHLHILLLRTVSLTKFLLTAVGTLLLTKMAGVLLVLATSSTTAGATQYFNTLAMTYQERSTSS